MDKVLFCRAFDIVQYAMVNHFMFFAAEANPGMPKAVEMACVFDSATLPAFIIEHSDLFLPDSVNIFTTYDPTKTIDRIEAIRKALRSA